MLCIFSCPEQLNRWPCHWLTHWVTHWLTHSLSHFWFLTLKSNPRHFWPLRHLIREMERHEKNTFWQIHFDKYNLTNTFWEIYLYKYICDTRQSCRLVTIETLITILTIENLNSWQSLLPDNQEWHWTAFAILAMFF